MGSRGGRPMGTQGGAHGIPGWGHWAHWPLGPIGSLDAWTLWAHGDPWDLGIQGRPAGKPDSGPMGRDPGPRAAHENDLIWGLLLNRCSIGFLVLFMSIFMYVPASRAAPQANWVPTFLNWSPRGPNGPQFKKASYPVCCGGVLEASAQWKPPNFKDKANLTLTWNKNSKYTNTSKNGSARTTI